MESFFVGVSVFGTSQQESQDVSPFWKASSKRSTSKVENGHQVEERYGSSGKTLSVVTVVDGEVGRVPWGLGFLFLFEGGDNEVADDEEVD